MKVLFITNLPTPYRIDFYSELGKLCDLTVIIEAKRSKSLTFNWNDNNISTFKAIFLNKGFLNEKKINWNILQYLSQQKYDKIVISCYHTATSMLSILYMRLNKIPYIFETDGGMIHPQENKLVRCIKRFFISKAKYYFSPSKGSDDYLIYYGAPKENIYRYPFTSLNKTDILKNLPTEEERKKIKQELGITEKNIILGIGQFIERKGFDILLQAIKAFNQSSSYDSIGVYIVGGKPTDQYLQMKKEWNLANVHFEGFKTKSELSKYYKAANIFILPTREDIWGLVINEAMAHGLPVITTNKCVAGIELLPSDCIIETNNHIQLKDKIESLINNKNLLEQYSQQNLLKISKYTTENMAKIHFKIFSTK